MADNKQFTVDIVTPDKIALSLQAISLMAPGVEGYFGILANHAPMMSELRPGKIKVVEPEDVRAVIVISGGFLEVSDNTVVILADSVDYVEEKKVHDFDGLNMAEADQSLEKAKKHFAELSQ